MNLAHSLLAAAERHPDARRFPAITTRAPRRAPADRRRPRRRAGRAPRGRARQPRRDALLYWAAQWAGVVFVPLSWRLSDAELDYCLDDCGAARLLRDGDPLPDGPAHPGALGPTSASRA